MKRVTIKDLAKELGVSLSTVNKALNGKSGISESRRAEIVKTAEQMGYKANRAARSLARETIKIGVVLPLNWPEYYEKIKNGILFSLERLNDYNIRGSVQLYDASDSNAEENVIKCFNQYFIEGINAIIFAPGAHHDYKRALKAASDNNIPVVSIGSVIEFSDCFSTVDVDSNCCGRLAAEYLSNILPENSKAAILIGSRDTADHDQKSKSFIMELSKINYVKFAGVVESRNNNSIAYIAIKELLESDNQIRGIYVAISIIQGVCKAVIDSGRENMVKIIATDVFDELKEYMDKGLIGATIYQNTFLQGIQAVYILYRYFYENIVPVKLYKVDPILYLHANYNADEKDLKMRESILSI